MLIAAPKTGEKKDPAKEASKGLFNFGGITIFHRCPI